MSCDFGILMLIEGIGELGFTDIVPVAEKLTYIVMQVWRVADMVQINFGAVTGVDDHDACIFQSSANLGEGFGYTIFLKR